MRNTTGSWRRKQTFAEYREVRDGVKEYVIAQENFAFLYEAERKKMKLTGNGSRKRKVENTRPGYLQNKQVIWAGSFLIS